jgi:hypothetical protein
MNSDVGDDKVTENNKYAGRIFNKIHWVNSTTNLIGYDNPH